MGKCIKKRILLGFFLLILVFIGACAFHLPGWVSKIYYIILSDYGYELAEPIVLDKQFNCSLAGYQITGVIDVKHKMPYDLILVTDQIIPKNIEFDGSIKVELFRGEELIYSNISIGHECERLFRYDKKNELGGYEASSLYGYHLMSLPFSMIRKFKNIKINVTVVKPALLLTENEFCLKLLPDTTL